MSNPRAKRESALAIAAEIYGRALDLPMAEDERLDWRAEQMVAAGLTEVRLNRVDGWAEGRAWLREHQHKDDYTWTGLRFFFWDPDTAFEFKMRFA